MHSESGHNQVVQVVIPTRKLNEITLDNIKVLSSYFNSKKIHYKITVVSNSDKNLTCLNYEIIHNPLKNAAISRNIGIDRSSISNGTYIFLDDDIILGNNFCCDFFNSALSSNNSSSKEICAPYITGYYVQKDYKFSIFSQLAYTFVFNERILNYAHLQGKGKLSFNFTPIRSDIPNNVEWITGGFMIFKNFSKTDICFDLNLFEHSYYLEDYYISNSFFLKGISLRILPFEFDHQLLYDKKHSNIKSKFKEVYNLEKNRLMIQRIRSKQLQESMFKFKLLLILTYLYRLKALKLRNLVSLFALISVLFAVKKKS